MIIQQEISAVYVWGTVDMLVTQGLMQSFISKQFYVWFASYINFNASQVNARSIHGNMHVRSTYV